MSTYVLKNNERLGPFDDAMIFTCLADGRFLYEDLAWREGWANWRQLREVFPAPSRKASDPATSAQVSHPAANSQTAATVAVAEENLWTGRPSYWNYWQPYTLALALVAAGLGMPYIMPYVAQKRWLAGYLEWSDMQPWVPLITAAAIGLGIAIILYAFMARMRRLYTVTSKRMIMKWGFFAVSTEEIRIQDIKSINVSKTGLSGIFLDVGTVEFSSAATDMAAVTFWQISSPFNVRDLVRKLQS